MQVENYTPADLLRPYIKSYTVIEVPFGMETLVLPHAGLVLAIPFRGHISFQKDNITHKISTITLSGIRKTFRRFKYEKCTGNILVTFSATGMSAFLKIPLNELFEQYHTGDTFFKASETDDLKDKISSATNNLQRIAIVEQFLSAKLIAPQRDLVITHALNEINLHRGLINIQSLAAKLAISQDAFEKRFRKKAGATPKQYSSIIRMKSIVASVQQKSVLSFTALGYEFGFYDQSHFIKDFKSFTGQSPKDFFRSSYHW